MDNRSSFIDEKKISVRILQALQNNELLLPDNKKEVIEPIPLSDETKNTIFNLF